MIALNKCDVVASKCENPLQPLPAGETCVRRPGRWCRVNTIDFNWFSRRHAGRSLYNSNEIFHWKTFFLRFTVPPSVATAVKGNTLILRLTRKHTWCSLKWNTTKFFSHHNFDHFVPTLAIAAIWMRWQPIIPVRNVAAQSFNQASSPARKANLFNGKISFSCSTENKDWGECQLGLNINGE